MILRPRFFIDDLFRLTGCLTLSRVYNFLLIRWGLLFSRITAKVKVYGGPFSISAEVAAVCNLRCPECRVGQNLTTRARSFIEKDAFEAILDAHRHHAFYASLYFQGEPLLNKELDELVGVAKGKRFYTSVATNGHFLDPDRCASLISRGLDRIIISLDGLSEKTYLHYRRGGHFEKVIKGIENLVLARKSLNKNNPLIVIQFLVNRQNEKEIPAVRHFAKHLGADQVQLKSMQVYDPGNAGELLPKALKFNRYAKKRIKSRKWQAGRKTPCNRLWSHAVYTSDTLLVPCCYDKLPEFPMSKEGSFEGVKSWFSPQMNTFRERVMHQREETEICCNCAL